VQRKQKAPDGKEAKAQDQLARESGWQRQIWSGNIDAQGQKHEHFCLKAGRFTGYGQDPHSVAGRWCKIELTLDNLIQKISNIRTPCSTFSGGQIYRILEQTRKLCRDGRQVWRSLFFLLASAGEEDGSKCKEPNFQEQRFPFWDSVK